MGNSKRKQPRTKDGRYSTVIAKPPTSVENIPAPVSSSSSNPVSMSSIFAKYVDNASWQGMENVYSSAANATGMSRQHLEFFFNEYKQDHENYEDKGASEPEFRYDMIDGVPQDEISQKALRKLGYEVFLLQEYPVFVYGTLRQGQGNNHLLDNGVQQYAPAVAPGIAIYGADRGFPYAKEHDAEDAVTVGDIAWLSRDRKGSQARKSMDYLEGFDSDRPSSSHYERVLVPVKVQKEDGSVETVKAWTYLARGYSKAQLDERDRINNGDWVAAKRAYREPKPRYPMF